MQTKVFSLPLNRRIMGAALCVLGSGALLPAFAQSVAPQQPPAILVSTALAKSESVQQTLTGIGNVLALSSVTVHARVDGQLDSVAFEEGQDVRAGQLLAQLDPRTYQAQLDQAQAQKAKDDALLANAKVDLKRYEELIKDDATTQQVLDTQKALIGQLMASIKNDEALINFAKVQLGFTTISAPISGRLGARLIDPGNIVHAADPGGLVVINQIDPIAVQFTLPETNFPKISQALNAGKKRLQVEAIDRASGNVIGVGELVLVNNQIDMASGTISLKARFPNPKHNLWPGQSVNARLALTKLDNVVTVPSAAIQRSQNGLFVYVVTPDSKVRLQPVTVAQYEGAQAVVSKGLAANDKVVVDGLYRLVAGASVKEAAPAPADKTGSGAKP